MTVVFLLLLGTEYRCETILLIKRHSFGVLYASTITNRHPVLFRDSINQILMKSRTSLPISTFRADFAAVGADIEGHILYACAATEINAHKQTEDFAVLITIQPASHTEG